MHCNTGSPSHTQGQIGLVLAAKPRGGLMGLGLLQGAAGSAPDSTGPGRTPVQPACRKRVRAERVPEPQALESPTAARKRARTERTAQPHGLENPPTASKKRACADASADSPDGLNSPIAGGKGRPRTGPRLRRGGPKATGGRLAQDFLGVRFALSDAGEGLVFIILVCNGHVDVARLVCCGCNRTRGSNRQTKLPAPHTRGRQTASTTRPSPVGGKCGLSVL